MNSNTACVHVPKSKNLQRNSSVEAVISACRLLKLSLKSVFFFCDYNTFFITYCEAQNCECQYSLRAASGSRSEFSHPCSTEIHSLCNHWTAWKMSCPSVTKCQFLSLQWTWNIRNSLVKSKSWLKHINSNHCSVVTWPGVRRIQRSFKRLTFNITSDSPRPPHKTFFFQFSLRESKKKKCSIAVENWEHR
jgi:hypothetical protein